MHPTEILFIYNRLWAPVMPESSSRQPQYLTTLNTVLHNDLKSDNVWNTLPNNTLQRTEVQRRELIAMEYKYDPVTRIEGTVRIHRRKNPETWHRIGPTPCYTRKHQPTNRHSHLLK